MSVRLEIHQWLATPAEFSRMSDLKDIAGCSAGLAASADPSGMIEKVLGPLVGAKGLSDAIKELATVQGKFTVKTQVELFAPAMVAMLQKQGGQGVPANADATAPLMEVTFNLAEISTAPVPDTVFQVPDGYQPAPLEDLIKGFSKVPAQAQPPKPQVPIAAGAAPVVTDFNGSAYRAGGGVSNPVALSKPEPKYTKEARQAKIEGSVLLSLVVDENGVARNIKVVQSLDPGLDQAAIDSVRQWRFKPGQKDGSPVAVMVQIQVTFRLV
jgi:TonB family protein